MRKYAWIVALLAALSLAFFACGGDGGGGPAGGGEETFETNLVTGANPYTVTLDDNFQYGEGYQGQINGDTLFKGAKIMKGDIYELDVTFTVSRPLEDALWVGLVDCVTNYWNPLSWNGDDPDDDGALLAPDGEDKTYVIGALDADEEVSIKVTMVALKSSPSAADRENVMNFQTEDAGTPTVNGSGEEGPVDLIFSKFVFTRVTVGGAPTCQCGGDEDNCNCTDCDCEACGYVEKFQGTKAMVTVGDDDVTATVTGTAGTITYLTDNSGYKFTATPGDGQGYGAYYAQVQIDLGTGNKLGDFKEIKVTYQGVTGDIGWKPFHLMASNAAFTGNLEESDSRKLGTISYSDNGKSDHVFTYPINPTAVASLTSNTLYIVPYLHAKWSADGTSGSTEGPTAFIVKDITIVPLSDEFVSVEGIEGVPAVGIVGEEVDLTVASAVPVYADEADGDIVWEVTESTATGVSVGALATGKFTATGAGTVKVKGTIADAVDEDGDLEDYVEIFTIAIYAIPEIENAEKVDGVYNGGTGGKAQWAINPFLGASSSSKYFVVATIGGGNGDGYGGVQFGMQGDGVSQEIKTTGDWTSLSNDGSEIVYFIFDFADWDAYDTLKTASWAQFRINYGEGVLGIYQGYIVDASVTSLTLPTGAVKFTHATATVPNAFLTKTLPVELTEDAPGGVPEVLTVTNPSFQAWGGFGSGSGNEFEFDSTVANCRITYEFPAEAADYDSFKIYYSFENVSGTIPAAGMKITISTGKKDAWSGDDAGTDKKYDESATDADHTWEGKVSDFAFDCITIKSNRAADDDRVFNLTISKIEFFNE